MWIRLITIGARRSSNNLGIEATYSYQQKMTMTQGIGIRPMAAGVQRTGSVLKAKANHYMREAWKKGKILRNASA